MDFFGGFKFKFIDVVYDFCVVVFGKDGWGSYGCRCCR